MKESREEQHERLIATTLAKAQKSLHARDWANFFVLGVVGTIGSFVSKPLRRPKSRGESQGSQGKRTEE